MTTPQQQAALGIDPELAGTTRPEVLQLALSGHLAAAAGGEGAIRQNEAEQVVGQAFEHLEAQDAQDTTPDSEPAPAEPAPAPPVPAPPAPEPAPSTSSTKNSGSSNS